MTTNRWIRRSPAPAFGNTLFVSPASKHGSLSWTAWVERMRSVFGDVRANFNNLPLLREAVAAAGVKPQAHHERPLLALHLHHALLHGEDLGHLVCREAAHDLRP